MAGFPSEWPGGGIDSIGSTSSGLIEAARERDEPAWQRLVDRYGPLVYHWCRRDGLQPEDAADVLQEVFRSVALHLSRFHKDQPGDTFRGWLWTITRNKVRDLARRRQRQFDATGGTDAQERLANLPEPPEETASTSAGRAASASTPMGQALESIRGEFSEQTWRAFWMTTVDGLTSGDVADELGMTANAVRLAKARIMRRLRKELGEEPAS